MANASRKHMGAGATGKGDGSGGLNRLEPDEIPENMVLSNRDKAARTEQRGLDSKAVQTDQHHDHEANQSRDARPGAASPASGPSRRD